MCHHVSLPGTCLDEEAHTAQPQGALTISFVAARLLASPFLRLLLVGTLDSICRVRINGGTLS